MAISIRKFPRAIIHIDGDSFFVACELTRRPDLVGKPVVTGHERGIATAMSIEAKRLGVTRGMPVEKIKKQFPGVVILSSDYENYTLYSRRMIDIVRRYTPDVDEYSIDECFADITGLRRPLGMTYEEIAASIKRDLQSELGITFSIGLSVNKVLAKAASNSEKPDGITTVPGYRIEEFLQTLPVHKVWGIGPNTSLYFEKLGIHTALDLAYKSSDFVNTYLTKPTIEIWRELRGEFVLPLNTEKKSEYKSIMKSHTFSPASSDVGFILGELSRNIETACARLRHHNLYAKEIVFYLKGQDFRHYVCEITLSVPTCTPQKVLEAVRKDLGQIYKEGKLYRATGIVLKKITPAQSIIPDLFGDFRSNEKMDILYKEIDALAEKFGKRVVSLSSSIDTGSAKTFDRLGRSKKILPLPLLGRVS